MRFLKSSISEKTTARPRCLKQARSCRRRLDQSAARRQIATQDGYACVFPYRIVTAMNYFRVPAGRVGGVFSHGLAVHGQGIAIDQVAEGTNHCGHSTRVVEILHQEFARRHQVDQKRKIVTQAIEIVEFAA